MFHQKFCKDNTISATAFAIAGDHNTQSSQHPIWDSWRKKIIV